MAYVVCERWMFHRSFLLCFIHLYRALTQWDSTHTLGFYNTKNAVIFTMMQNTNLHCSGVLCCVRRRLEENMNNNNKKRKRKTI